MITVPETKRESDQLDRQPQGRAAAPFIPAARHDDAADRVPSSEATFGSWV